jgi:hypothetical protein
VEDTVARNQHPSAEPSRQRPVPPRGRSQDHQPPRLARLRPPPGRWRRLSRRAAAEEAKARFCSSAPIPAGARPKNNSSRRSRRRTSASYSDQKVDRTRGVETLRGCQPGGARIAADGPQKMGRAVITVTPPTARRRCRELGQSRENFETPAMNAPFSNQMTEAQAKSTIPGSAVCVG